MSKIKELKNKLFSLPKTKLIPILVAGLVIAGVASATLLTVYVTAVGTGEVSQAVVFGNGDTSKTYTILSAIAGNTYTQDYNLKNQSETTAPIRFNTLITPDPVGIETTYWSTVDLSVKNTTNWTVIDGAKATLTYELISPTFNYKLEATGLTAGIDYSLIYYADQQNRFVNWGGNNPGALIVTAQAGTDGKISVESSEDLAMNLPALIDWNGTAAANYCNMVNEFDDYDLCRGAKIWLVPSIEYNSAEKKVSWANPGSYLYETDLITYGDSSIQNGLYLGTGMLNFFVKNVLAVDLQSGTYNITTNVVPAK